MRRDAVLGAEHSISCLAHKSSRNFRVSSVWNVSAGGNSTPVSLSNSGIILIRLKDIILWVARTLEQNYDFMETLDLIIGLK